MTTSNHSGPPIKVLIAKPGLDGHDVGAKLVCRALMDAGMNVIYTGLRQSPESIVQKALEEDVDVVGLSVLSGAHIPLTRETLEQLRSAGLGDVCVMVGGNIPTRDRAALQEMGVLGVFPTGTAFDIITDFVQQQVQR